MEENQRLTFLTARDRNPSSQAIGYIENHVGLPGQPLPVFSERANGFVSLDEARQHQEESQSKWKEVRDEIERLFELMEQVYKKLDRDETGRNVGNKVNLRKCDWKAVLGEVERTAQRWKSRPNKQGKVMVFVDKVGRHSVALEAWLGLLPMGDYGSSICGVFKIAIGAAGQYTKVEESIFEALSEIPRIMESAKRYVDMYRQIRDQFLEQRTIELFRAILTFLRQVMQFFLDDKSKKFIGSLMKQSSYKEQLFESVDTVKACAQVVNEEASQCQARMVSKVYENTEHLQAVFHRLMDFLLTNPRFQATDPGSFGLERDTSRLDVSSYDLLNVDHLSLQDKETSGSPTPVMPRSPLIQQAEPIALSNSDSELAKQRLLQCLNYDPEVLARDISSILSLGYMLNDQAKSRVAAMLRHDKFQTFMTETQTSVGLLVNGRGDLSTVDGISPFSLVVAELAQMSNTAMIETAPVFIVKYFCSEHQTIYTDDPSAMRQSSATGMMVSIVGQLIREMTEKGAAIDISSLTDSKWRKLERLELHALCTVFNLIVKQAPKHSVILCILDEISVYETSRLEYETNLVVRKLVQLVRQSGGAGQPVFKLLLTCYDHALDVSRFFSGSTLDLHEQIETDDSSDWIISNRIWL